MEKDSQHRDEIAAERVGRGKAGRSRRAFVKTSAALAGGAVRAPVVPGQRAAQPGPGGDDLRRGAESSRHMLLKGGTIISMDPQIGDLVRGDVLIEGKKIAAVAREVTAPAGTE